MKPVGGGSVINGATSSSFYVLYFSKKLGACFETKHFKTGSTVTWYQIGLSLCVTRKKSENCFLIRDIFVSFVGTHIGFLRPTI